MKIGLSPYLSSEIKEYTKMLNFFEVEFNDYFKSKNYGPGISEIFIGIICVAPEFDHFFKPRRPKYYHRSEQNITGDTEYSNGGVLEYDIKLDYEGCTKVEYDELKIMIAKNIWESVNIITSLKKIKEFDYVKFNNDLIKVFKNMNIEFK